MLSIIKRNPFRILGVYANATLREITTNQTKIKRFLNVGKTIEFPTDLNQQLGTIERTSEIVESATSQINLPHDKIQYALFWFANATPIDSVALNHMLTGNTEKAIELWNKKECFSSLLNKSTLSLISEDYTTAIPAIQTLIHSDIYRSDLVNAICGDNATINEDELFELFVTRLSQDVKIADVLGCISDNYPEDKAYFKEKAAQEYVDKINAEIAKAQSVKEDDAQANYLAGHSLIHNTKEPLAKLKELLPNTDMLYQQTADSLANQILQSGINYYNHTNGGIDKAFTLQNYALSIAVGKLTKDRCKKNVDVLKKRREEESVKAEIDFIVNALERFNSKYNSIANATQLVMDCKPHLNKIENKIGKSNELYLTISSAVANSALGMLIASVNSAQKISPSLTSLESTLSSATSAMNTIGSLAMNTIVRKHFDNNNTKLKRISQQCALLAAQNMNINTHTPTSGGDNTNWGCIIAFIVAVLFFILTSLAN